MGRKATARGKAPAKPLVHGKPQPCSEAPSPGGVG